MVKKTDSEALVPVERKVRISGEEFEVKPFSVKNMMRFGRELVNGMVAIQKSYPEMDFKPADLPKYLPLLLDEVPRLFGLIALALRPEKDAKWLEDQTDLAGVSELFASVCEINDFGAVISNFRKGWIELKKQTIKDSAEQ